MGCDNEVTQQNLAYTTKTHFFKAELEHMQQTWQTRMEEVNSSWAYQMEELKWECHKNIQANSMHKTL